MKKIYRASQKRLFLRGWIGGLSMHKYGLPYRNACGHIFPRDVDLVERMLEAAEKYPDVHVVTELNNGWTVNRYQADNARCYYLYKGDADPELEFTNEFTLDDFTAEEIVASQKRDEEFSNRERKPVEIAAVNFAINALLNRGREET